MILVEAAFSRQLTAISRNRGPDGCAGFRLRYTSKIVKRILCILLLILLSTTLGLADETSFSHVKVPSAKGKDVKAVLTFSDKDKALEVHPAKGDPVTIPYGQIDKCAYEYSIGIMCETENSLD